MNEGEGVAARLRGVVHHIDLTVRDLAKSAPFLDAPAEYPQYGTGYYAVFMADPDGIKVEVVHFTG